MTENQFRRIVSAMPDVVEASHMGHPDFRLRNRIFATLRGDGRHGMVVVTPDQQADLIREHPDAFLPESGAWGRQGCTRVRLAAVDEEALGDAVTLAWQLASSKPATTSRTAKSSTTAKRATKAKRVKKSR